MIATAAEKNPSVFRSVADGGRAHWKEVVRHYIETAMSLDNRWGNTKFLLAQIIPGKEDKFIGTQHCRSHVEVVKALGFNDLLDLAQEADYRLQIKSPESGKAVKRAAARAHSKEESKKVKIEEVETEKDTIDAPNVLSTPIIA